jgi:hypothetical protein
MASPQSFFASPTLLYELGNRRWIPLSAFLGPQPCGFEDPELHLDWSKVKGLGIALLISSAAWALLGVSVAELLK